MKKLLLLTVMGLATQLKATKYYINDNSTSGDVYTTAVGNNANNGLSPGTPKATLANTLSTYAASFAAGDTIFIDKGNYTEIQLSSPANGVVIKGAGLLKTLITKSGSDRYFMIINDNNTVLSDLKLSGYDNQTISGVQALGIAANTTGVQVLNVQVDGCATSSTLGGYPIEVLSGASVLFQGGGMTCNTWDAGGGMQISGATTNVIIKDYQFIGNYQLWGNGTAIKMNNGTVNIYNSRFEYNQIGGDKSGMGIDMTTGTLNVYDSYFANNLTNILSNSVGGAVSMHGGTTKIKRCVFKDNIPESATSGIYGAAIGVTAGTVNVDSCKFSGNVGARANDLYVKGGTVVANNCTFGSAANQIGIAGGSFSIANCGSPSEYGAGIVHTNTSAPTYTANPSLPDYVPVSCVAIPCTTPTITSVNPSGTICSGTTFTTNFTSSTTAAQTSYSWISSAVAGITGHATSGNENIEETLTNTTSGALNVTYTVTPTFNLICNGPTQTITVTVQPAVNMTSANTTSVCSDVALNFNLTSNVASGYSWIATDNANTSGESLTTQSDPNITNTINNNTSTAQVVTYNITPTSISGNCVGITQTLSVTVNATPTVTSLNNTSVCSGTSLSYNLTASPTSDFSWIAADNANTSGESTTTQNANSITNTLINSSNSTNEVVTYSVTPTSVSGGCVGSSQTLSVTVYPTPIITSANPGSVCSGIALSYTLTGSVASSFSWQAGDNANTSGESLSSQSSSIINNTLINNTNNPEDVIYTITPTSTTGSCLGTAQSLTITVNPAPTITSANNENVCSGTALSYAITSSTPSSYTWLAADNTNTNGESTSTQNTASITDVISHTQSSAQTVIYTITPISTVGACTGTTQTLTVTVDPTPQVTALTNPASACAGETVAAYAFTTEPFGASVSWTNDNTNTGLVASGTGNPITGFTASNVSAQEISIVSITPTLGSCIGATASYTLTVNPNPAISTAPTTINPSSCGGNDGSITGLQINGPAVITYSWNGGAYTTADITGLTAGAYNVAVTDGNGCTVSGSYSISDPITPSAPAFTINNSVVCEGDSAILTITNPLSGETYNWFGPSGPLGQGTSLSVNPASTGSAGTYNASTTAAGCTGNLSSNPVTLTVNENPVFTITSNGSSFCEDASLTLNANVTNPGGTATIPPNGYQWILNGSNIAGATSSTYTTAQAGTYELSITNSNNCTATFSSTSVSVYNEPHLDLSSALIDSSNCLSGTGNIFNVTVNGGSANYNYSWYDASNNLITSGVSASSAAIPLTGQAAGTYQLIVVDNNGCNDTINASINNYVTPAAPMISSNPANCSGAGNAPVVLTTSGGTITWYSDASLTSVIGNGNPFNALVTTTDTIYATEMLHNCESATTQVLVTVNPTPNAPAAIGANYCQGDVIQDLFATGGGGSFTWFSEAALSNAIGTGSPFVSGITATDTVYVTETALGCISVATQVIVTINNLPNAPLVIANGPLNFCNGDSVLLSVSPGSNVIWTPGNTTDSTLVVYNSGSYSVTYTDGNGCSASSASTNVTVFNNPTPPTLSLSSGSGNLCNGDSTTINATPATGIVWSTGTNGASITINTNGIYSATYTDGNNCTSPAASINVLFNPGPTIYSISQVDTAWCNNPAGGLSFVSANGGTSPYTYQWFNNGNVVGTDSILVNVNAGNYQLLITDANGCTDSSSVTTVPSGNGPNVTLSSDVYTGNEPMDATLTSSTVSGNPIAYTWLLDNVVTGNGTTPSFGLNDLAQGTYIASVVAIDINGCFDTSSVTIVVDKEIRIIIPNIFSPNGDGINEGFAITADGLKDLKIIIYDRWGLEIFSQEAANLYWNGNAPSGERASDGTYFYIFTAKDLKDKVIERTGYLMLVK